MHTCRMHTVMIRSPDFLEKNENVAEEIPLVLTCLLISVTFNVVPPPPMSRSMPLFVLLAIFHPLTWDEFSPKSPHCLSRSLQANCALQLERERDKKNKRERGGLERGSSIRNTSLEFLLLLGGEKVIFMTVTLNRLLEQISMMNM